jgi:outer membrane protein OmpA-like peptidoglycan-associated protein
MVIQLSGMRNPFRHILALLLLIAATSLSASAQSNQFRDSQAHIGVGLGLFTYHGPIDLLKPRGVSNFVREHDPAIVFLGSFPLKKDLFFFRGMALFTNISTKDGRKLVGTGQNEFLTSHIFMFETQVVMTLRRGSKSRIMPYIFTGFGATTAGLFNRDTRNNVDLPGRGVPGPERSVYHLPVGIGVDVAFNGCWSAFAEASYRWDLNYVWRNEKDYDPHNTSLVMAGIRGCIRTTPQATPPPAPIPPPLAVPGYDPPLPRTPRVCTLIELNSVYFASNTIDLSKASREDLDENIEALRLNPTCCVSVIGYAENSDANIYALRLARQRADAIYNYYIGAGLRAERFTVESDIGPTVCPKGKDGKGCVENYKVATVPFDCSLLYR